MFFLLEADLGNGQGRIIQKFSISENLFQPVIFHQHILLQLFNIISAFLQRSGSCQITQAAFIVLYLRYAAITIGEIMQAYKVTWPVVIDVVLNAYIIIERLLFLQGKWPFRFYVQLASFAPGATHNTGSKNVIARFNFEGAIVPWQGKLFSDSDNVTYKE